MSQTVRRWKVALAVSMSLIALSSQGTYASGEPIKKENIAAGFARSAEDLANKGDVAAMEEYLGRAGKFLSNDQIASIRVSGYGEVIKKLFQTAKDGIAQKDIGAFSSVIDAFKLVTQSGSGSSALVARPGQSKIEEIASRHFNDYLALLGKEDAKTRADLVGNVTIVAQSAFAAGMKVEMPRSLRNLKSIAPGQTYSPEKDGLFALAKAATKWRDIGHVEDLLNQISEYAGPTVIEKLRTEVYTNEIKGRLSGSSHQLKDGQLDQGLKLYDEAGELLSLGKSVIGETGRQKLEAIFSKGHERIIDALGKAMSKTDKQNLRIVKKVVGVGAKHGFTTKNLPPSLTRYVPSAEGLTGQSSATQQKISRKKKRGKL